MVFRKSDVEWNDNISRGWEMMLSYSFKTNLTSGYIKAAPSHSSKVEKILGRLEACYTSTHHPLLLPLLALSNEFTHKHDSDQRELRRKLRKLESDLSKRYKPAEPVPAESGRPHQEEGGRFLEDINWELADYQCKVMQKRPQAWQNVVQKMKSAMDKLRSEVQPDHKQNVLEMHDSIIRRLDFLMAKLEGLEHYAHVTMERMHIQREVVGFFLRYMFGWSQANPLVDA